MKDILMVEDNDELASLIRAFMEKKGYRMDHVKSGEDAMRYLVMNTVKLVILDVCLPGMDGFAVCRAVREQANVPILILSARSGKADKLNGFGLGADDYVEKPVDVELLAAKIRAMLQRAYGATAGTGLLVSGGICIERCSRKVYRDSVPIELNAKEYDLLLLLVQNPGKTLHKDYLFRQIWGIDSLSETQTLTVHVTMLRSKIEEDPRHPERIITVWGIGYRYEEV